MFLFRGAHWLLRTKNVYVCSVIIKLGLEQVILIWQDGIVVIQYTTWVVVYFLHRVGIIGEPMAGFNPLTLVPFGEGQEENGDENESRRA